MSKCTITAVVATIIALAMGAAPVEAKSTRCTGFGGFEVSGNLEVPHGHHCVLVETTVTGNVTVRGSLEAFGVNIAGNLIGNHAEGLVVDSRSVVGGNVFANHTTGGENRLCATTIGGNVTIQESAPGASWKIGPDAECRGVTVGGNLTFKNNQGGGDITDNHIGGNLDCHNNTPAPTGGGNTVGGNTLGQCAGF